MKQLLMILCAIPLLVTRTYGQTEMYHGGFGTGDAYEGLIAYNFADPYMYTVFHGGSGDGHAYDDTADYTFPDPPMYYAFFGGSGDGYSGDKEEPYNFPYPPMYYAYFGGVADGYAGDTFNFFIVLPVQLLSFEGKVMNDDGYLQWKVAGEKDITTYALQRSTDGRSYKTIHTQSATAGSSGEQVYSHLDEVPSPGANYYRLQINQKDGRTEYSHVVMLLFGDNAETLTISPNPASSMLMVHYSSKARSVIRILDMKGTVLKEQGKDGGTGSIAVPVDGLASGYYLLQFMSASGMNKTLKFVKQ